MQTAASTFHGEATDKRAVTLRETIIGSPVGDVTYVMTLDGSSINIEREAETVADVTFTQSYDTAVALHKGELTTQEAFFAGNVKIAGHLNTLLENAELLQGVAPVFEDVKEDTTY